MGDIMRPIPFGRLMDWALDGAKGKRGMFGVARPYRYEAGEGAPIFSGRLEAPFGPAAGPHTQLAQNIIAAYAAGSRFFELKTVQIIDGEDLPVEKPCITAADECYNCEWSTELRVEQAFGEYVRAWYALKLLSKELKLGDPDGFVFNMSVGYDLAGIQSQKIDGYIEGMKDAAQTSVWKECRAWARDNLAKFANVDRTYVEAISPRVSESITLSTLHGCPPQEIERIASYLIKEKNLHTYIKCNPTLLGYQTARDILDKLGYDYIAFDDHHFKADLQFADAVPMLERLSELCLERGLQFGVKLTNTFPVDIAANELPGNEMYMSGRSLFPLSIAVAEKLAVAFGGKLRISYSGGADAHNIRALRDAGIWPVTVATTLLKPGGYQRASQLARLLKSCGTEAFTGLDASAVQALAKASLEDPYYRKPIKPMPQRKRRAKVPLMNCFLSPCRDGCPIGQDIPEYVRLVGEGKHLEALRVIVDRNPLPFITGTICSHHCMDRCVRNFYDDSVKIRSTKLEAAEAAYDGLLAGLRRPDRKHGRKVAVVGGGAAGLAAAYFLAREGVEVTVFEKRERAGGIVRDVIPAFRIQDAAIDKDIALVEAMGAKILTGVEIASADELRKQGFTDVVLACGAWSPGELKLEYGEALNVLDFLEAFKKNPSGVKLGKDVAIVGAGNTAMDAARAAKRAPGVENVRIIYRRTKRYMPADEEELRLAMEDGVEFYELLAPVGHKDGRLACTAMRLGAADATGRRSPVVTDTKVDIPTDTVIAAVGEGIDRKFFAANGVGVDARGRVMVSDDKLFSETGNVYVIGDAHRGPSTVVEAIADAMAAAQAIAGASFAEAAVADDRDRAVAKRGVLAPAGAVAESERCLECSTVCECCVDVCPNRANLSIDVPGMPMPQIVHVDRMCNECGNCETFCPYESAPYKDKLTVFGSEEDFADSDNSGFVMLNENSARVRLLGEDFVADLSQEKGKLARGVRDIILSVAKNVPYVLP